MLLHIADGRLPVMLLKLIENVVHMILDRRDSDAQLHSDLLVAEPLLDGTDNSLLTAGESFRGLQVCRTNQAG